MAQALVIEEESGISRGFVHPHNGYYAGDFHQPSVDRVPTSEFAQFRDQASADATVVGMVNRGSQVNNHTRLRAA